MDVQIHAQITIQANQNLLGNDQLATVVNHNMLVDVDQFNSCLHFDNCAFACGADQVSGLWAVVDAQQDRVGDVALGAFGRLLHTTQDFYAHSNWVELHVDADPIPIWDQQPSTLPAGIVSGTFSLDTPKLCGPGAPAHADLNKDDASSKEGARLVGSGPHQGRTLFELALAVAVAASQAQFQRLGKGIPPGQGGRAPAPLTAADHQLVARLVGSVGDRARLERGGA